MKIKYKAIKFYATTSVMMTFAVVLAFLFLTKMGEIDRIITGCNGTDEFYTGNNFYADHSNMINRIINLPNAGPTNALASPRQMLEGHPFDCNSISNAIHCLAEEYDMPCRFVITYVWTSEVAMKSGHIGIECYDSDFDNWTLLY